jgi:molybdenum cofactor cytidylyltransferase
MTSDGLRTEAATVAAVVLAAGGSERLGGEPKALLPVDGVPGVRRMVDVSAGLGLDPVVVVVGPHGPRIRAALRGSAAEVVDHPAWAAGRTGSIQAGLAAVGDAAAALLWPVDHPFVEAKTVGALLDRGARDTMAVWVIPTFAGRGGHPVLLRSTTFGAISALPRDRGLRSLLAGYGPQVARFEVDDPGVTENIDTRDAYEAARVRRNARGGASGWTGD